MEPFLYLEDNNLKLGLIIGRFQPLHNGHLSLIAKAQEECEKVLVLVGSTNRLPDFKHPFPYEERLGLLKKSLDASIDIRPLPDKPTDDEWIQDVVGHVLSIQEDPTEVTLYCGKKDEAWYRKNLLYPIETENEWNISATEVRAAWYTDTLWTVEDSIPLVTQDFLEKHEDKDRLATEYTNTLESVDHKRTGHPFSNPMEPVSFAVIIRDNKLLVGKRQGWRGKGQYGLAGGYIQNDETTLEGCIREVNEELSLDLQALIRDGKAKCMAQSVEENLNDIGTRTLGINYLFVVHPDVSLDITVDEVETSDYKWIPLMDVLEERELLFYNHNLVTQRLISKLGSA